MVPIFSLNWQLRFFGPNLPKRVAIFSLNWILLIRISLCIKFDFEHVFKHFEDLENLITLKHFERKIVMSCLLGSFYLKILWSFSNSTEQIAMITKVIIKFRSKFQFQIPFQFYRIVEKVETYDGNGQKFWQLPSFFQPSNFGYFFAFSWLRFKYSEYKGTLT